MNKPVFGSFILGMHSRECISIMHFAKNNVFGKILKLFIRSNYAEKKLCLVGILKNTFFLLNNILLVYIM
jgi:hypothetical protein